MMTRSQNRLGSTQPAAWLQLGDGELALRVRMANLFEEDVSHTVLLEQERIRPLAVGGRHHHLPGGVILMRKSIHSPRPEAEEPLGSQGGSAKPATCDAPGEPGHVPHRVDV